ncbi:hypothetical protein [Floridanema evergladense]|uniref:Uncharacterized protein n=1 Tax=Floridaenema evergladense BLCC-F167 TaxID=3153639 RepID=A0ABV4WLL6_9CYAN
MSYIESNLTLKPNLTQDWFRGCKAIAKSQFWFFLLLALATTSNVIYTCTVPLVGFGAIAGSTLPRRRALATVMTVWLVNQVLGFGFRQYPWTITTFAWGLVLALGAILVTLLASLKLKLTQNALTTYCSWLGIALIAGFAVYQLTIWLACFVLGGCDSFTLPILWGIFQGNAIWGISLTTIHSLLVWDNLRLSQRH